MKTLGLAAVVVASAITLLTSCARTPAVVDTDGEPVPEGIAVLEEVELNGSRQWITIRGHDAENPLLLFLAGGPGASELASTRLHLSELEEIYTVVNWDQPGAGKSFRARPPEKLTPRRYVEDGLALIDLLLERFDQEELYILGESWGTVLGVWLAQAAPQRVAAYVGSGQMVSFTENDVMGYELAISYLDEQGNEKRAKELREQGPPPYTTGNVALRYMRYLDVLNVYTRDRVTGNGHDILRDALRSPEYTLRDRVNWIRGLMRTFNRVYPQLQGVDLRLSAPQLDVPVYMILGRHDVHAMSSLAVDYYETLEAPRKKIIWVERSGHPSLHTEPQRIMQVMTRVREDMLMSVGRK
ncbi:MAG: alpha/beta fold hydrolase [Spirochaetes bacterium]|jgi:pimeloyl-ACP methyl ester carboxylesterase|nr:alpha/beta fold hydrolase [Spirochaetota bacterium]